MTGFYRIIYDIAPIDGKVSNAKIFGVLSLDISLEITSDLTGIEMFKVSIELICDNNLLISLDVNVNTTVIYLERYDYQLTDKAVTGNTALSYFGFNLNQLTDLDMSVNNVLFQLSG